MNVDIYVEKENGEISLQEWLNYVKSDDALVLEEVAEGINPLTKQKLRINIPGRVIFQGMEICYRKGRVGCEDFSDELLKKLKEIATVFEADVYDCGEKID